MNFHNEQQNLFGYFLGELSDEENLQIERRCFDDDIFAEQIFIAEGDLIEAYLGGRLDARQTRNFKQNYLVTEARRQRLELIRNLLNKFAKTELDGIYADNSYAAIKAKTNGLVAWWRHPPVVAIGFGALLIAVCIIAFLLVYRPDTRIEQAQINNPKKSSGNEKESSLNQSISPKGGDSKRETNAVNIEPRIVLPAKSNNQATVSTQNNLTQNNLTKKENTNSPPKTTTQKTQPSGSVAAFALFPGNLRGGRSEQTITLENDGEFIDLNLNLQTNVTARQFQVKLQTAEGADILTQKNLKIVSTSQGKFIRFRVQAAILREQTYVIALSDDAPNPNSLADYVFKAKKTADQNFKP